IGRAPEECPVAASRGKPKAETGGYSGPLGQRWREARARDRETSERVSQRPGPEGQRVTPKALQFARDQAADAESAYRAAGEDKRLIADTIRHGREDGSLATRGAVWSPALQRFLDVPEVQQGIRRGWGIERELAVGRGERF